MLVVLRLPFHFHHHHFTTHVAIAAGLALASAVAFAMATVAQQRAAAQSSDDDARGGQFVGQLLRSPLWLAGTLGTAIGYVLQAVALAFGSLLVVQPLLVTSLLVALPLGARLAHRPLPRSVWAWGLVLAASLAVFVSLGNANNGASHASRDAWFVVVAIVVPIVVGCLFLAHPRTGSVRASLLAVAVGLLAGVLAVLTKAVVGSLHRGVPHTLGTGELYGLLVVGAVGIYVQQLSFQAGELHASLPIIMVLEPVVAATFGLVFLHEKLRVDNTRMVVLGIAVAALAVSTIALARGEGKFESGRAP